MGKVIFDILRITAFTLLTINVMYLFVYSLASIRKLKFKLKTQGDPSEKLRFAVVIAAYKEDSVIEHTVKTCLAVDYPRDKFDVVVVSDHMQPATNEALRQLPIKLLQVDFDVSSNTRSLKVAVSELSADDYDVIVIVDADNLIPANYLSDLNCTFADTSVEVVQTHRTAKNLNTDMAYLDAVSEEVNNSIFRKGHARLGMSAALIGSGMAFRFGLFKRAMLSIKSIGGFDRELELRLLFKGIKIHYLQDTCIKDEKIQKTRHFYKQRRRWLAAQYESFGGFSGFVVPALKARRWDFCDKLLQQAMLSRILLLGITGLFAIISQLSCGFEYAAKWWTILALLIIALLCAIPRRYYTLRLLKSICLIPVAFFMMFINLFRMSEARKKFIHTEHSTNDAQ